MEGAFKNHVHRLTHPGEPLKSCHNVNPSVKPGGYSLVCHLSYVSVTGPLWSTLATHSSPLPDGNKLPGFGRGYPSTVISMVKLKQHHGEQLAGRDLEAVRHLSSPQKRGSASAVAAFAHSGRTESRCPQF